MKYETSRVEYKLCKSSLSKSLWETVSSFSNEGGGMILLGYEKMNDKYVPVGLKNPSQLLDDFTSTVGQKFNFCPLVNADIESDRGKPIIAIVVKEAPKYQKPIYIKDAGPIKGGFKRVGATDLRLTDQDVHHYYLERMGAPDAQAVDGSSTDDINPETLSAYRSLRKLIKVDTPELEFNDKYLLKSYSLLVENTVKLTAAGLLLFGKEQAIRKYFPAIRLDIIRIKGIEWGKDKDPFLSRDLKGNLITIRSIALDFMERFFLIPFQSDVRGDRIEENAHSNALRESLTNLLMHQDYFGSSPAQVIIYNDRVEFYNAGYSLKNPDEFDTPGSKLRNPNIASVFYDLQWAESKGTGLKTTTEALKKEGYELPYYINNPQNNTFRLILPHPVVGVTPKVTPQVTPQVEMRDRIAKILQYCEKPRSLKEMMEFLELKDRKNFIYQILNPLLEKNYLERTIPDKPRSRFQKYVRKQ
ncbi:putative DNA binding domain-containing protein [candidate division WOR-3 bacterium]|nr:putative DNA binding domain-containing protein [candidate division WOR-3 bacterium]